MAMHRRNLGWAALLWALSLASSLATVPATRDDGWDLALTPHLAGKGGWTTCYLFARALQWRFTCAGGENHLLIFDWTNPAHAQGRHAFLVYRDAEGRYWGMDNLSAKPRWLPGTTPMEWAVFWAGESTVLRVTDATDRRLAGRTANATLLAGSPLPTATPAVVPTLVADNRSALSIHRRGAKAIRPV